MASGLDRVRHIDTNPSIHSWSACPMGRRYVYVLSFVLLVARAWYIVISDRIWCAYSDIIWHFTLGVDISMNTSSHRHQRVACNIRTYQIYQPRSIYHSPFERTKFNTEDSVERLAFEYCICYMVCQSRGNGDDGRAPDTHFFQKNQCSAFFKDFWCHNLPFQKVFHELYWFCWFSQIKLYTLAKALPGFRVKWQIFCFGCLREVFRVLQFNRKTAQCLWLKMTRDNLNTYV